MLQEIGANTRDEITAGVAGSAASPRPTRRLPGHAAKRVWLLSRLAGGEANRQAALQDWSFYEAELIAELIELRPELLTGPWAILLALVQNDADLWVQPGCTDSDGSAAAKSAKPFIDVDALYERLADLKWRAWASL